MLFWFTSFPRLMKWHVTLVSFGSVEWPKVGLASLLLGNWVICWETFFPFECILTLWYYNSGEFNVMQVANINVKQETPVGHGKVTCFSIYSGTKGAEADFGNGKTCIWVDVLDGGPDVLMEFVPFFEDSSIRKVKCSLLLCSFVWRSGICSVPPVVYAYCSIHGNHCNYLRK